MQAATLLDDQERVLDQVLFIFVLREAVKNYLADFFR